FASRIGKQFRPMNPLAPVTKTLLMARNLEMSGPARKGSHLEEAMECQTMGHPSELRARIRTERVGRSGRTLLCHPRTSENHERIPLAHISSCRLKRLVRP